MMTDSLSPGSAAEALAGAVLLSHWGVIAADGEDAAKFLHSQLTHDFALLGHGEARLAGYCSPKGRLLASFVGWKDGEARVLLACRREVLPPTLKRLSMFVLRAKAKLTDATDTVHLLGLVGDVARVVLGDAAPPTVWGKTTREGVTVVRLPDAAGHTRYLWAGPADAAAALSASLPALPLPAWRWLEVESAVPTIVQATADQFVPQMVNLEAVGGVSFQKGCYPGQEVVARSQYRGTLKRRGALLHSPAEAAAGQEIFHSADPGQPAGLVVDAAPVPAGHGEPGWRLFAELKLAALHGDGSLHLGGPEGVTLTPQPLPYPLPTES
ncbi:YgfZ/GcvT domain-containing protein [Caldimonas brevitalea]|uniref:Folate-binding protein n=1 Tax=Caldimonas brevitalea TaxID=413882 RepID=A0A0G3BNG4_9BURK|nr:folate-binding protein YgfZ [Caldimonas brevitalea]AKJ29533.1 folate-binding protein [Caldimonas brevitalea]